MSAVPRDRGAEERRAWPRVDRQAPRAWEQALTEGELSVRPPVVAQARRPAGDPLPERLFQRGTAASARSESARVSVQLEEVWPGRPLPSEAERSLVLAWRLQREVAAASGETCVEGAAILWGRSFPGRLLLPALSPRKGLPRLPVFPPRELPPPGPLVLAEVSPFWRPPRPRLPALPAGGRSDGVACPRCLAQRSWSASSCRLLRNREASRGSCGA